MDVNTLLLSLNSHLPLQGHRPCRSNPSSRIAAGECRHIPCGILGWPPKAGAHMAKSFWAACGTGAATMLSHSCQHLQEKAEPGEAVELWFVSVARGIVYWCYYWGSKWEMSDCGQESYLHWGRAQCSRKQGVMQCTLACRTVSLAQISCPNLEKNVD